MDNGAAIQSGLNETDAMPFDMQDIRTIRLKVDVLEINAVQVDKNATASINFPELPWARFETAVSRLAYGLGSATRTTRAQSNTGHLKIALLQSRADWRQKSALQSEYQYIRQNLRKLFFAASSVINSPINKQRRPFF